MNKYLFLFGFIIMFLISSCKYKKESIYGVTEVEGVVLNPFGPSHTKGVATNIDFAKNDGVLKYVTFQAVDSGTVKFGVGLLTDDNHALIDSSKIFSLFVDKGIRRYDVFEKKIKVIKGECLFLFVQPGNKGRAYYGVYNLNNTSEKQIYYNNDAMKVALHDLPNTYGGFMIMEWVVIDNK